MQSVNWRVKAIVQRACASVPLASDPLYYGIQRRFGTLKNPKPPWEYLAAAAAMASWLNAAAISVDKGTIVEIGTGRKLDLPIGFFLCGARRIETFDLYRYLRQELVLGSIAEIGRDVARLKQLFAGVTDGAVLEQRFRELERVSNVGTVLKSARIGYHAPADARATRLASESVDAHVSYTVFEHIPEAVLRDILIEARRILKPGGVLLHHIDPSDHFSHADSSISAINFLQFSRKKWHKLAGNRFAYHNRLRVNEFLKMFEECGFEVVRYDETLDERSMNELKAGFPLDPEFQALPHEVVCCRNFRILAKPQS
jgi:SAM-dependent methyltransferase